MAQPPEGSPYQLLVEGKDDFYSIVHLLKKRDFDFDDDTRKRPRVRPAGDDEQGGGREKLLAQVSTFLDAARYERVGIVIDADDSVDARWQQMRGPCREARLDLPDSPDPAGTVVEGGRPTKRVGFWIMPDNVHKGRLEDFLIQLVPPDDDCWGPAKKAVEQARLHGCAPNPGDDVKYLLYTWLAWRAEPGRPFGTAVKAGYLRAESDAATPFVRWFHRLFAD